MDGKNWDFDSHAIQPCAEAQRTTMTLIAEEQIDAEKKSEAFFVQ